MNRRQKIIVSVTGIFLVLLILVGLTYAYFLTRIIGNTNNKSISVTTADLELTYHDGNGKLNVGGKLLPGSDVEFMTESGTLTKEKTFSVENTGDSTVDSYAVILEDLKIYYTATYDNQIEGQASYLDYPETLKYTLTCESSIDGNSCFGKNNVQFPTTEDILTTNSIEENEVHTYKLTMYYANAEFDQSNDMNKSLDAKINIIDTKGTADIKGEVTDSSEGDTVLVSLDTDVAYEESKSDIKKLSNTNQESDIKLLANSDTAKTAYLNKDGEYKVVGLPTGNYTITVQDASESLTIQKGQTASVDTANKIVTVTDTSRVVTVDLDVTNKSASLSDDVKPDAPFQEGTLAYQIYYNAMTATKDMEDLGYALFRTKPLTVPGKETTYYYKNKAYEIPFNGEMAANTVAQKYTWTYSKEYELGKDGKFNLVNPKTCNYKQSGCISDMVENGENIYVVSNSASSNYSQDGSMKGTTGLKQIYRIIAAPPASNEQIELHYRTIVADTPENTLSRTIDDDGISYYFRGGVKNNYLEFNNMCWRIVRIEGDGSVKVALAKEGLCSTLKETDLGTAFLSVVDYGYIETEDGKTIADYENSLNRTTSMSYKFNVFLNGGSFVYRDYIYDEAGTGSWADVTKTYESWDNDTLSKLKTTQICMGDKSVDYDSSGNVSTSNSIYGGYYDNYLRLSKDDSASLKCHPNGKLKTNYKIYPLTADELIFAGGTTHSDNNAYYLMSNTETKKFAVIYGYGWWTGSLGVNLYHIAEYAYVVENSGRLILDSRYPVDYSSYFSRPAISLVPGIEISEVSGDGTKDNPYIVK